MNYKDTYSEKDFYDGLNDFTAFQYGRIFEDGIKESVYRITTTDMNELKHYLDYEYFLLRDYLQKNMSYEIEDDNITLRIRMLKCETESIIPRLG